MVIQIFKKRKIHEYGNKKLCPLKMQEGYVDSTKTYVDVMKIYVHARQFHLTKGNII